VRLLTEIVDTVLIHFANDVIIRRVKEEAKQPCLDSIVHDGVRGPCYDDIVSFVKHDEEIAESIGDDMSERGSIISQVPGP